MATGSARYVRYILVAFFVLAVFYFVSNSADVTGTLRTTPPTTTTQNAAGGSSTNSASPNAGKITTDYDPAQYSMPLTHTDPGWNDLTGIRDGPRMNATFVTLARNSDVWEIAKSIRHVEDRFNRRYNYDWVFLNDQPFDDLFKNVTASLVSGKTHYGLIPKEHWSFPEWIDKDKAEKVRQDMKERKIIYGDSISYRHMCRFESGFFFRQELMLNYEWYWRVEPSVELFCDIHYDPFRFMHENKKKYSFVLSLYEYIETIPTLWDSVKKFIKNHPEHVAAGNSMGFLSDDGGDSYNRCHFWSNFEIGNLNWLRSKAYIDYFESLDRDGGFFYERWGDAPVHSIAAGIMLHKEEIHFFNDIAYYHVPFTHCPTGQELRTQLKCHCNPDDNFDWKGYSCTSKYYEVNNRDKPEGWEQESKD
ncbi:nucleotide-diphospho-sugar transferase [Staphylotrichum tortipilum]|uniref:Nucleotide-diphospho-sugar transferase n=1 Tax=Staphylotrichum tortipilum TaxID=2831512 RepID=A0AAN6MIW8_9PEZI|nr:nucleotide-diphospho-sugar transferase [Staphylotrichum longicolle]